MSSKEKSPFRYIETPSDLAGLVHAVQAAKRVALDTEAASLHLYFNRVCLVQVTVGDTDYIVDPIAEIDLAPLMAALAAKPLVLHGADYDLRKLREDYGFRPKAPVFDTMIAAQLLGYEHLGLAALLERFFGVTVTKAGQKSNWAARPLTAAQLDYARDDTHYLEALADKLAVELEGLGRLAWHQEACADMVEATAQEAPRDPDDFWRVKGSGQLDRRELAYLRAAWTWRDEEAQRLDRPAFKVMANPTLIELATWLAKQNGNFSLDGFRLPRNCSGSRRQKLERALQRAHDLPESKWPNYRKRPRPENDYRREVEAMRAACAPIAEELGIAQAILAPKSAFENIAKAKARTRDDMIAAGPLMRWQADLIEPRIRDLLPQD